MPFGCVKCPFMFKSRLRLFKGVCSLRYYWLAQALLEKVILLSPLRVIHSVLSCLAFCSSTVAVVVSIPCFFTLYVPQKPACKRMYQANQVCQTLSPNHLKLLTQFNFLSLPSCGLAGEEEATATGDLVDVSEPTAQASATANETSEDSPSKAMAADASVDLLDFGEPDSKGN